MERKTLSILAIELYMPARAFSLSHLCVAFLITQHVAELYAKTGYLLQVSCWNILAASSSSIFICRLISRLENKMTRVKRRKSFKAPVYIGKVLLVEGQCSFISLLLKYFENDLKHDGFLGRIGTLKVNLHFIHFGTVFVSRTDVDYILDSTGGTVVIWHDVAFFLTSSIELAFRKLEQQHKEF
jgi:hypothetical protein